MKGRYFALGPELLVCHIVYTLTCHSFIESIPVGCMIVMFCFGFVTVPQVVLLVGGEMQFQVPSSPPINLMYCMCGTRVSGVRCVGVMSCL